MRAPHNSPVSCNSVAWLTALWYMPVSWMHRPPLHAATAHPCTFHTHPHPKRGLPARMSRCRLTSNALAFSTVAGENAVHRAELLEELSLLREAYSTLLYGGYMRLQVLHTKDSNA